MDLFHMDSADKRLGDMAAKLDHEITALTDEAITTKDLEELADYFVSKYILPPYILYLDQLSVSMSKNMVTGANPDRYLLGGPASIQYEVCTFHHIIPFDGDTTLLYYKPNPHVLERLAVDRIVHPKGVHTGEIHFSFSFPPAHLEDKEDDYIQKHFDEVFKTHLRSFSYLNAQITAYNISLRKFVEADLDSRRKKAEQYASISNRFQIPIKQSAKAPGVTPIPIKRTVRTPPEMPASRPQEITYGISDEVYASIKKAISLFGNTMEHTAPVYRNLSEDDLRSVLLAHLNSYFDGNGTAEAFSNTGKTDIRIQFESKAAYIAECKLWLGPKYSLLTPVETQLLSYPTWRDSKLSLIVFNKDRKNFTEILHTADRTIRGCELLKQVTRTDGNEWNCTLQDGQNAMKYQLQIILFHLFGAS